MKKPTLVFTRPADWVRSNYGSNELNLVHVPIGGEFPRRKNGKPAGDGVGEVATTKGIHQLIDTFKKYKPELFLYWVHFNLGTDIFARLKTISPNTIFICGYGNQPHEVSNHVRKFKDFIDVILLNSRDENNYKMYYDFGLKYVDTLHDGFDPYDWQSMDIPREYDVFFGGNQTYTGGEGNRKWIYPLSKFRYDLVCEVHRKFKLRVHGNKKLPFKVFPYMFWPDYAPKFQTAKIILGSPHYDLKQYYSRRTIHGGACGRFFITRYIPDMEEDFGSNHEIMAWFTEIDEAIDLIDYYVKNDEIREKKGAACRKLFLEKHTWKARLMEMEKIAKKILS